jgi:hypothetical protein
MFIGLRVFRDHKFQVQASWCLYVQGCKRRFLPSQCMGCRVSGVCYLGSEV